MNSNLTLDDIYFKDAFTQTGNKLNFEVDNAEVESISSKNNAFSLDCNGNLVVNSITTNSSSGSLNSEMVCDIVYPVGSIYMSVNSVNPSTLFGGTWAQLKDRFLLGCGDTYVNDTVGGEATHTLTVGEMPNHTHGLWNTNSSGWDLDCLSVSVGARKGYGNNSRTLDQGGGLPHNNMPPYLAVYMWKRID